MSTPVLSVVLAADYSVRLEILDAGGTVDAVQWQIDVEAGDFSAAPYDSGETTTELKRWISGLPKGTDLKARVRIKRGGVWDVWSAAKSFRTSRIYFLGSAYNFDPTNEGSAPELAGVYGQDTGAGFVPGGAALELTLKQGDYAGLQHDVGVRMRMAKTDGSYSQDGLPSAINSCVRYGPDSRLNVDEVTIVMVCVPEIVDLGFPYGFVLAGGFNSAWWIWSYNNAGVGTLGFGGADQRNALKIYPVEGTINHEEPALIILKFRRPFWHMNGGTACPNHSTVDTPSVAVMWVNGEKSDASGSDNEVQDGVFGSCSYFDGGDLITLDNYGRPMIQGFGDTFYAGMHSSGGAQTESHGGRHGFVGTISEFAYMPDFLISDAQAESLYSAYAAGDMDLFATRLKAMDPLIYDRFTQPAPPNKPLVSYTL